MRVRDRFQLVEKLLEIGQIVHGFCKALELLVDMLFGVPLLSEVPYRHAGQVAENDAAGVACGRLTSSFGELGKVSGDDGSEFIP